jgi:hypothetical protein
MSADVLGEADKADRFPVHATTHAILDFLNTPFRLESRGQAVCAGRKKWSGHKGDRKRTVIQVKLSS